MLWAEKGKRIERALHKSGRGRSGFLGDSEPLPNTEDSARQKLYSTELGRCPQGLSSGIRGDRLCLQLCDGWHWEGHD